MSVVIGVTLVVNPTGSPTARKSSIAPEPVDYEALADYTSYMSTAGSQVADAMTAYLDVTVTEDYDSPVAMDRLDDIIAIINAELSALDTLVVPPCMADDAREFRSSLKTRLEGAITIRASTINYDVGLVNHGWDLIDKSTSEMDASSGKLAGRLDACYDP